MIKKIRNLLSGRAPAKPHATTMQIQLVSAACPYCGVRQDPPPQRRRMCRDCGELIYVLSDSVKRTKCLSTAENFNRTQREQRDNRWQELSNLARAAMEEGDWGALESVYTQQVSILFEEGRPHRDVAVQAHRAALMRMQGAGVNRVKVLTAQDERVCRDCQSTDGKTYAIRDALETTPLPGKHCTDGGRKNPHGGRCRCVYLAVL